MQSNSCSESCQWDCGGLLEGDVVWDMEGRVLPTKGIFGKGSTGRLHLMEGGNAITFFELPDVGTHALDDTGDIVT